MHGLKQLVYDNQPFFSSNQTGKTNRELYILWKQNKRDDIFLLLYTQLWMVLEEVYMENVIDYYKKDCYEKKLFFELVEYQKRFFKKNIKIQLLTGYFYATTEYLFFLNKENDIYNIVDEGKNIIKKLYDNNQEKFEVYIFYICILQGKRKKWIKKRKWYLREIKKLFPSNSEIDQYFREIFSGNIFTVSNVKDFVTMIVCNIQLQNKKDSFIKKSYSIPVGIFPGNKATIDDKGNIYVATGMLGVVQKFNKNGDFIKSILIKDDIDMIKNERDGIHVYAGKFDYTDYHITEKKIIEKEISETDLDHIKSGPNELVIGNFWIFKGKITILKSSLFPIDPFIIMYTAILMEIIFWIKAKISRFRENKSSKSVVITGGDEIGS